MLIVGVIMIASWRYDGLLNSDVTDGSNQEIFVDK